MKSLLSTHDPYSYLLYRIGKALLVGVVRGAPMKELHLLVHISLPPLPGVGSTRIQKLAISVTVHLQTPMSYFPGLPLVE